MVFQIKMELIMKNESEVVIEKRLFLKSFLASSIFIALPGCSLFCPPDALPDFEPDQFIADIHCHVFNAKDIPVFGFVKYVAMGGIKFPGVATFIGILVNTISAVATPGYKQEEARLVKLLNNTNKALLTQVDEEERINLKVFKATFNQQIDDIHAQEKNKMLSSDGIELMAQIRKEANVSSHDKSLVIDWFERLTGIPSMLGRYLLWGYKMTQYRYQHIKEIKRTYPAIKLFTPALVDFDRWFASNQQGADTQASIKQQMQLSILHNKLNNGSIHPFVPFDPLRDVETGGQVYIDTVNYIERFGAIGIKLYPPMGFRVYENANIDFCRLDIDNLGAKLDESLMKMYSYCHKHDIPILAHTAHSNYNLKCEVHKGRANPIYWRKVLKKFNGLRVNMGHFATHSLLGNKWSRTIRHLMLEYPNVYADFSHIEGFGNPKYDNQFFSALHQFLDVGSEQKKQRLLSRFLYGSDWIMLAKERISKGYFAHVVKLFDQEFSQLNNNEIRNNFIGGNAFLYLGLDKPETVKRLKDFYNRNTIAIPQWLEKPNKKQ